MKTYKGITITEKWTSNTCKMYLATVNGKCFESNYLPHLKKQIRKNITTSNL